MLRHPQAPPSPSHSASPWPLQLQPSPPTPCSSNSLRPPTIYSSSSPNCSSSSLTITLTSSCTYGPSPWWISLSLLSHSHFSCPPAAVAVKTEPQKQLSWLAPAPVIQTQQLYYHNNAGSAFIGREPLPGLPGILALNSHTRTQLFKTLLTLVYFMTFGAFSYCLGYAAAALPRSARHTD